MTLSTTVVKDLTSINLTAGDWDVGGNMTFSNNAVGCSVFMAWISLTSATQPNLELLSVINPAASAGVSQCTIIPPSVRISLAGTTTVYISGVCNFLSGNETACGSIYARRVR